MRIMIQTDRWARRLQSRLAILCALVNNERVILASPSKAAARREITEIKDLAARLGWTFPRGSLKTTFHRHPLRGAGLRFSTTD